MTASTAPSVERLDAAVRLVVGKLAPDQIILFGSAARNEMTASSDVDLLVIKDEDGNRSSPTRHERWHCPESGDQIDVVIMNRATAERRRLSASYVQGAALEEGRTVYLRDGATPTATGPTYTWNGVGMVKTTKFEPDHAARLLDNAEGKWEDAHLTKRPANRCQYLHDTIEQALKALITADGRRIQHTHELEDLWQQAEATGEQIGATRNPKELEKLTRYAGNWRYDTPDDDPEVTWSRNRTTGEDVLNHARRRVQQLIDQTRQALASRTSTGPIGGETPPDPATSPAGAQSAPKHRGRWQGGRAPAG